MSFGPASNEAAGIAQVGCDVIGRKIRTPKSVNSNLGEKGARGLRDYPRSPRPSTAAGARSRRRGGPPRRQPGRLPASTFDDFLRQQRRLGPVAPQRDQRRHDRRSEEQPKESEGLQPAEQPEQD